VKAETSAGVQGGGILLLIIPAPLPELEKVTDMW
jgi:hypothetical protein